MQCDDCERSRGWFGLHAAGGRWTWLGRAVVAFCLTAAWGVATVAPLVVAPGVALAQDEEMAEDELSGAAGCLAHPQFPTDSIRGATSESGARCSDTAGL